MYGPPFVASLQKHATCGDMLFPALFSDGLSYIWQWMYRRGGRPLQTRAGECYLSETASASAGVGCLGSACRTAHSRRSSFRCAASCGERQGKKQHQWWLHCQLRLFNSHKDMERNNLKYTMYMIWLGRYAVNTEQCNFIVWMKQELHSQVKDKMGS